MNKMAYYTNYNLHFDADNRQEIIEVLEQTSGISWNGRLYLFGAKWYQHDNHMLTLSTLFPSVLFTLDGEGESQGDIWIKQYKNGKTRSVKAQTIIPPIDQAPWTRMIPLL